MHWRHEGDKTICVLISLASLLWSDLFKLSMTMHKQDTSEHKGDDLGR